MYVQSFLSHNKHKLALISLAVSQTPVYTARHQFIPWNHRHGG